VNCNCFIQNVISQQTYWFTGKIRMRREARGAPVAVKRRSVNRPTNVRTALYYLIPSSIFAYKLCITFDYSHNVNFITDLPLFSPRAFVYVIFSVRVSLGSKQLTEVAWQLIWRFHRSHLSRLSTPFCEAWRCQNTNV
jgi:hypothetical protein